MAEKSVVLTVDGQELQQADLNLAFATAGLADDRVLAELLRLLPYDGTNVYKAILPYTTGPAAATNVQAGAPSVAGIVQPNGASGSVLVYPFRAIVGSRNAANGAPSPASPTNDTDALANWRDIRSGVFVGGSTSLTEQLSFAANSSGNPRWDVVYATISPDTAQNTVTRRVKDPSSGALSTPSEPQYDGSPVVVGVVQGTATANPSIPDCPGDAAGNYIIPIAAVWIPNGFGATSTVQTKDIRPIVTQLTTSSPKPTARIVDLSSGFRVEPATGNNDISNSIFSQPSGPFAWATGPGRPGPFLPPGWVGGRQIMAELDLQNALTTNWSHQNGAVVDASCDWRNRMVLAFGTAQPSAFFGNDRLNGGNLRCPLVDSPLQAGPVTMQMTNSFGPDGAVVTGDSTLLYMDHTRNANVASGTEVALYVDPTSGALKLFVSGLPSCRVFVWLMASAQQPNY